MFDKMLVKFAENSPLLVLTHFIRNSDWLQVVIQFAEMLQQRAGVRWLATSTAGVKELCSRGITKLEYLEITYGIFNLIELKVILEIYREKVEWSFCFFSRTSSSKSDLLVTGIIPIALGDGKTMPARHWDDVQTH